MQVRNGRCDLSGTAQREWGGRTVLTSERAAAPALASRSPPFSLPLCLSLLLVTCFVPCTFLRP